MPKFLIFQNDGQLLRKIQATTPGEAAREYMINNQVPFNAEVHVAEILKTFTPDGIREVTP